MKVEAGRAAWVFKILSFSIAPLIILTLIPGIIGIILALFATALLVTIYNSISNGLRHVAIVVGKRRPLLITVNMILLGAAAAQLYLYAADVDLTPLRELFAVLLPFYIPGYALVVLGGFPKTDLNWLEKISLSFSFSVFLLLLFPLFFIPFGPELTGLILCIVLLLLSFLIIVKNVCGFRRGTVNLHLDEVIVGVFALSFSSLVVCIMYPGALQLPGADIAEFLRRAAVWARSPEYVLTACPGFTLIESVVFVLAGGSPLMQAFLALLNINIVLAFFLAMKALFDRSDQRLPLIATLLFSCSSGFGWFFVISRLITGHQESFFEVLRAAWAGTYIDIPQGGIFEYLLWFRPRSLALILLFLLLYTIADEEFRGPKALMSMTMMVVVLFLVHAAELVLLVFSLVLLSLIKPVFRTGVRRFFISILCSWVFVVPLYLASWAYGMERMASMMPISLMALLSAASLVGLLALKFRPRRVFPLNLGKLREPIALFSSIAFITALLAWLEQAQDFSFSMTNGLDFFPWFFYSTYFGMIGVLALVWLWRGHERTHDGITLLLCLVVCCLVAGRSISMINTSLFYTDYQEWRLAKYSVMFSFPLAAMGLLTIARFLHRRYQGRVKEDLLPAILVSIVVVGSFTSTAYSLEYWTLRLSRSEVSLIEQEALSYLSSLVLNMRYSKVLTATSTSSMNVRRALPTEIVGDIRHAIWKARSFEVPLILLYEPGLGPDDGYIVYLHLRDKVAIKGLYEDGVMNKHILSLAELRFINEKTEIYVIPKFAPPQASGRVAVLTPLDGRPLLPFDILSMGHVDYSSYLDVDLEALSSDMLVIPADYIPYVLTSPEPLAWVRKGGEVLVLGEELGGFFSHLMFYENMNLEVVCPDAYMITDDGAQSQELVVYDATVSVELTNLREETAPLILSDDNQTYFWRAAAWRLEGIEGHIGVPKLFNDVEHKVVGENGLRIEVGDGEFSVWLIYHEFENGTNWSDYDFLSFYWWGRGDGTRYEVWVYAPDPENRLWFLFRDDWVGWRKVLLPLKSPPGIYEVNGIYIYKTVRGNADLANVTHISIRLAGGCPNQKGTWFLDRVILDLGRWVDVDARVRYAPFIEVYAQGPEGPGLIANLSSSGLVDIPSDAVVFSDGSNGCLIYGNGSFVMRINATAFGDDSWLLRISARLPPSHGEPISRLRITLKTPGVLEASDILVGGQAIRLPAPVECALLTCKPGVEVLAWYIEGPLRSPLLVKLECGEGEIFFVRLEPILETINQDPGFFHGFLRVILRALEPVNLPRATVSKTFDELKYMLFERAEVEGTVEASQRTVILVATSMNLTVSGAEFQDVVRVIMLSDEPLKLTADDALIDGLGFYATLHADQLHVIGNGADIELMFRNGSCLRLEGDHVRVTAQGENLKAFLREAELHMTGNVYFKDTYTCSSFEGRFKSFLRGILTGETTNEALRLFWRDLRIEGELWLRFVVGGGMNVASMSFCGLVEVIPPLLTWDEAGSMLRAWPYALVASIVVLIPVINKIRPSQKR